MPEGFVQQVLDDADEVLGVLPHVITTLRRGVLIANAGVDQSNVDPARGDLVALPRDPDATAVALMRLLRARHGVPVGVIVADSVVHALRRGTAGCALGVAGIHAVSSELGRPDLFGREMRITSRAVADNICSAALLLMGETDESLLTPPLFFCCCCCHLAQQRVLCVCVCVCVWCPGIPMVVVRGSRAEVLDDRAAETATTAEAVIPRAECIYMGDAMVPNPKTQEYLQTVFAAADK